MHDGKEAVRAMVFACDASKPFVGYLMHLTPEGKAAADKAMSDPNWKGVRSPGKEVKRPGSSAWIAAGGAGMATPSQAAMAKAVRTYEDVISVRCPDGSANALMVEPE